MFASKFLEGDSATAARLSNSRILGGASHQVHHRTITMVEDFDVVHNILYYIYTNRITFSNVKTEESDLTESSKPRVCDAEEIYALAHRLELEGLQSKALHFLKSTCDVENIIARVFSQFASLYEEVGKIYEEYFRENWEKIRKTMEFREYFSVLEDTGDLPELRRVLARFRELMNESMFVKK